MTKTPEKMRCRGIKADGTQCKANAQIQGFCGRHKDQIDSPEAWQQASVEEIERRKQYALMRKRELEVGEEEGRLVDASLARGESTRLATQILDTLSSMPARRSHEIGAELSVAPGKIAAALERALRTELKEIAEAL